MSKNKITQIILVIITLVLVVIIFSKEKVNYRNEISKQDLVLKCEKLYSIKNTNLEKARYGTNVGKKALIWSQKTKSCLAYYNVDQGSLNERPTNLFEVWDYTNDDLILSYKSHYSGQCLHNGVMTDYEMFTYKFNKNLSGAGCGFDKRAEGIDFLTNFESAMLELGFKK